MRLPCRRAAAGLPRAAPSRAPCTEPPVPCPRDTDTVRPSQRTPESLLLFYRPGGGAGTEMGGDVLTLTKPEASQLDTETSRTQFRLSTSTRLIQRGPSLSLPTQKAHGLWDALPHAPRGLTRAWTAGSRAVSHTPTARTAGDWNPGSGKRPPGAEHHGGGGRHRRAGSAPAHRAARPRPLLHWRHRKQRTVPSPQIHMSKP